MARTDWNITQSGGQAIVDEGGSKRCRLSGTKLMLWNGRSDLSNCEIVASILMAGDTNTRGGLVLRCDPSENNCYRLRIYGPRSYYLQKIVTGVVTTLATAYSTQAYNTYVKTRFRVDGYQISLQEYLGGQWSLISVIADTEQSLVQGYAGLYGESASTNYFVTFDDITISDR
jgi:hypothetical protein